MIRTSKCNTIIKNHNVATTLNNLVRLIGH